MVDRGKPGANTAGQRLDHGSVSPYNAWPDRVLCSAVPMVGGTVSSGSPSSRSRRATAPQMASPYKRPPITEAVIEVRLDGAITRENVDKVQKRLLETYPFSQETQIVGVEVSDTSAKVQQQFQGYRLTNKDGADTILISPSSIASARLAPYEGWEKLIVTARQNWDVWKRLIGYRKVVRVGVRYINRIDVPEPAEGGVRIADYLSFHPQLPNIGLPPLANFTMNTVSSLGKDECKLTLNAGSVPSPLVKTVSFVLDLDVSRDSNMPQNDDDLWGLIGKIRDHKNAVFEGCITNLSRQLFS